MADKGNTCRTTAIDQGVIFSQPCCREELEQREISLLAPWAQCSAHSRGRVHEENRPDWRTEYQRDRDRIIHSRAFRRLEYKTQVFLNGTGDHLRTRLTHTMEVAAITRNIARALRLNEDLAEAIALAHDLGHAPFGHKGEDALNHLMKDHGGFEHNRQSLRIVEQLEQKYPSFPGLNLSWEVREGLAKHITGFDHPQLQIGFDHHQSSLEAQVANLSDEIAYYSHDLDDGLEHGLLSEKQLNSEVECWRDATTTVKARFGDLPDECRRYFIIRCIIDNQVHTVVGQTLKNIELSQVKTADDARSYPKPLVAYGEGLASKNLALREFLYGNLYFNPVVHEPNQRAVHLLKEVFNHLVQHPEHMTEGAQRRVPSAGLPRAVCDYLAGMTDRFLIQQHQILVGHGLP